MNYTNVDYNTRIETQTTKKHSVLIHPTPFKEQPDESKMGMITNKLKRIGFSKRCSIEEIFERFSQGHNIILADVECESINSPFTFISSSIFAIDVDDTDMVTNPEEVLHQLKDEVVGLFYTFSHGIKGNRYRLVYQLSRSITDDRKLRGIIEVKAKELLSKDIPVDLNAKVPTLPVRGGRKGYIINNYHNTLDVDSLLKKVERMYVKRQEAMYDDFDKDLRPVPFDALKEMAELVGHIPSGTGDMKKWSAIVHGIKHYANTGFITQEEGFELFDIISGGEKPKTWDTLKPRTTIDRATIGSLIHYALEKGYKGRYNYFPEEEVQGDYEQETVKVKQYIPIDVAEDILTRGQRILVDSPTGSGKTSAFIGASKKREHAQSNEFFIIAMPTIALTMQTAHSHQVMAIKGNTKDLFKQLHRAVMSGKRVFISTYDMTPQLIEFIELIIQKYKTQPKFFLVVDELHKFVTDYDLSYRYHAIQNLYKVSKEVHSFIGLSGTIDDIYKQDFEKVIHINNGNPQSPCLEVVSYTYEKRADCLPELAKLIEVWTTKRKLLIYIQSKEKISQLQSVLRTKGIKVRTISADSKSNSTYKQLIEHESIDPSVQVVLTTSVIADGVNINNVKRDENGVPLLNEFGEEIADLEWEVIAVCNEFSKLFNPSSLKQISNRLRKPYRRFSLFMQVPSKKDIRLFQIEGAFNFRKKIADKLVDELSTHPFFDPNLFRRSVIERQYGIFQTSDRGLDVDTLLLRHKVSVEQERYYMGFRYSFIQAIKKALHYKSEISELNVSEKIRENQLDTLLEQQLLKEIEEEQQLLEQGKGQSIGGAFTREVYKAFLEEDESTLATFKKSVQDRQYACLKAVTAIADYETCMKVVTKVKRNADVYSAFNSIRSLVDVTYQQSVHRPLPTTRVLDRLVQEVDVFLDKYELASEFNRIAKAENVTVENVKQVCRLLVFEEKRTKKARLKRVSGYITVQSIASRYGLTEAEVVHMAMEYSKRDKPTVQKVVEVKLLSSIITKEVAPSLF